MGTGEGFQQNFGKIKTILVLPLNPMILGICLAKLADCNLAAFSVNPVYLGMQRINHKRTIKAEFSNSTDNRVCQKQGD